MTMQRRMVQTAFRLTETDLALLDAAQEHAGLPYRVEALRYVLREWARMAGVDIPSPPTRNRRKAAAK